MLYAAVTLGSPTSPVSVPQPPWISPQAVLAVDAENGERSMYIRDGAVARGSAVFSQAYA